MGSRSGSRGRTPLLTLAGVVVVTIISAGTLVILPSEDRVDQGGLAALASTFPDPATLPVTVPFDYVDGHIVVDVTISSGGPTLPMVLDSGAPTILSAELAETFGQPAGTVSTSSVDGRAVDAKVVTIPELGIGGALFRDVGALSGLDVTEPGNPLACLGEHGFIGANLARAVWQIDYPDRELTIAPAVDGLDHIEGAIRLGFERASGASPSPLLGLPAGEGALTLLVDTGSDGWIIVNPSDLRAAGGRVPADAPALTTLSAGAGGSFADRLAFAMMDLDLDDFTLPSLLVATSEALPEGRGILGNEFLSHFVVTIDWTEDVIYLEPLSADIVPEVPLSATLTWRDGYVLGSLADGPPGAEDLTVGTEVVAIDGEDATGATFEDYCARFGRTGLDARELTVAGRPPVTLTVTPVEDFYAPLQR